MRRPWRAVATRADALNEDGSLNQLFFRPTKVVFQGEKAKWNDTDKANLYAVGRREWRLERSLFAHSAPVYPHTLPGNAKLRSWLGQNGFTPKLTFIEPRGAHTGPGEVT